MRLCVLTHLLPSVANATPSGSLAAMFHPDDLAHAFGVYLGAMKSGDAFSFEYRVKGKDDKLRWHMCQGRPHYDETGAISNWMCNTVNIDDLVNVRLHRSTPSVQGADHHPLSGNADSPRCAARPGANQGSPCRVRYVCLLLTTRTFAGCSRAYAFPASRVDSPHDRHEP